MTILYRDADLHQLPKVSPSISTHVSLGDIHGNTLKLIYVMIEEGVLELTDDEKGRSASEKYHQLRDIYNKPVDTLEQNDLSTFQDIINSASIHKKKAVTLIGDELADRGNNDYFTLLVLKKLKEADVNIDIMLSNHSVEFIKDFEKNKFTGRSLLGNQQAKSLSNMYQLISQGLIKEEDVRKIVNECYKPMVKALGYGLSADGNITLFSHAPIGLETVKALANKFNVPYEDRSPKALIHTIDSINIKIQESLDGTVLASLIDNENYGHESPQIPISDVKYPLQRLVWNRALGDELITQPAGAFAVNFVHGHIGDGQMVHLTGKPLPSHQNIDSTFGKPGYFMTGYDAYYQEHVRHFTRQSLELTAKELTGEKLNEITNKWAANDVDTLVAEIKTNQNEFSQLLEAFKSQTDELIAKNTPDNPLYNSKYADAGGAAVQLISSLSAAGTAFFSSKCTQKDYDKFQNTCNTSIQEAKGIFENQRGWAAINPILRGILGVVAALALIPALIVSSTAKQGYLGTFFNKPQTGSAAKLDAFSAAVEKNVHSNIKSQMSIKSELDQLKSETEVNPTDANLPKV